MMRKFIVFLIMAMLLCVVQTSFADVKPNDQYYSRQWGLKAIHAPAVWEVTTGSSNVHVFVIDSGIDINHGDLRNNINTELSRNFIGNDSTAYNDENGHGTHVAGIIAAEGNNGQGISGTAWHADLIVLRGDEKTDYTANAIQYITRILTDNPAMKAIVNISLSNSSSTAPNKASTNSNSLWKAMHELDQTGRALMCVSSGNHGIDIGLPAPANKQHGDDIGAGMYVYPAAFTGIENMIVVANAMLKTTGNTDFAMYVGSNYNADIVHIAAPGSDIFSTLSHTHEAIYDNKSSHDIRVNGSDLYVDAGGTSMASPFVAGTAALLLSAYPDKSIPEIKSAILKGANGKYLTSGERTVKYGMLDAIAALDILAGKKVEDGVPIDELFFPDQTFREYILKNFDTNGDRRINDGELSGVTKLDLSGQKISRLDGIKYFADLRELNCSETSIESFDSVLLQCQGLEKLNLRDCTHLTQLHYSYNGSDHRLSELDVKGCSFLRSLDCVANDLTVLDLRGLDMLQEIYCDSNKLTVLDLPYYYGGIITMSDEIPVSVKLTETDDSEYTWLIDISKFVPSDRRSNISGIRFSKAQTNEGNSGFIADIGYKYSFNKEKGTISVGYSLVVDGKSQTPQKPARLAYNYNTGSSHVLTVIMNLSDKLEEESDDQEPAPGNNDHTDINASKFPDRNLLEYVKRFDTDKDGRFSSDEIRRVTSLYVPSRGIISMKGAEIFTSVISLDCRSNNITDINSIIRVMTSVRSLQCGNNKIVDLNITSHPSLEYVSCGMSTLKSINLSGCRKLNSLIVDQKNTVTSLNISRTALKDLSAWSNGALETLDASDCTALKRIYCSSNSLTSLNITGCLALEELSCGRNSITELNLSGLTAIKNVDCSENTITSLTIKGCSSLASLNCEKNSISSLELDGSPSLSFINCGNNPITELDITALRSIETVLCAGCDISLLKASGSRTLKRLDCRNNALTEIDLSGCSALERLTIYDYSEGSNPLRKLNINSCEVLRDLSGLGGEISEVSAENCKRLTSLYLGDNMTTLNVKGCISLDTLSCSNSKLEHLDISGCVSMQYLYCEGNNLPSLALANLPALVKVTCGGNKLTVLDVIDCLSLYNLDCSENSISEISLSGCPNLHTLYCYSNDLHALDISPCVSLDTLDCRNNHLPYIEINPPTYHVKLYGQVLNGLSLTETGDSSWPYSFSFNRIIPLDRIENIAGWPSGYEINHVRAEINAYDENGSTISMNYSNGTAYFSERPSSMIYGYNILSRILNAIIYFAGSNGHDTTPGVPAENEDTPHSDNTGNDGNTLPDENGNTGDRDDNFSDEINRNICAILGVDENIPVQNLTRDNANIVIDRKNTVTYGDTLRVVALLPEIQVYADGVYIIPVSFDTPAHYGEYLTWHPFYDDVNSSIFSSSRNENCVFLNDDGSELAMPLTRETDYLKVATYLETGKVYAPAVSAGISSTNTENPSTSSGGGGCEAFTTLWALFAVFIIVMKKNV